MHGLTGLLSFHISRRPPIDKKPSHGQDLCAHKSRSNDAEADSCLFVEDGAFVVRRRQAADDDGSPYALTLAYDGQIYHMLIRRRDTGKFSLGAERPDQHVRLSHSL